MDAELSNTANGPEDSPVEGLVCPNCAAPISSDAVFCPDCRWPLTPPSLKQRAVATAAYLPLIPPAVILFLPAFRRDRFVRFHAWQSLTLWVAFFILSGVALFLSNIAAAIVFLLFVILVSLAMLFLWFVLSIKAWQGVRFEIPLFGLLAARTR
jgi:uncharacterized membrane protein